MSALRSSCRRGRGRARCAYVSRVLAALILIAPSLIADRAIAYAAPPTTSAQPVRATFRVLDVVGQSPGLVGRMLGRSTTVTEEPGDRAHGVRTRMYSYRKGPIEISFVRGKADWITYRPAALAYNAEVVLDPSASNTPCRRSRMNMCSGGSIRRGCSKSSPSRSRVVQLPLRARTHEAVTLPPSASASTEAGLRDLARVKERTRLWPVATAAAVFAAGLVAVVFGTAAWAWTAWLS